MTASHILVLAIAVPLFVYGIIRLAQLLATGIAEQEQGGTPQHRSTERGMRSIAVPWSVVVPLGIAGILGSVTFPSFIGWEALLVVAILAAYYAITMTWWQYGLHARSDDWRRGLLLAYLTGWMGGAIVGSSIQRNGARFGMLVFALLIAGKIVLARRSNHRAGTGIGDSTGTVGERSAS